MCNAQLYGNLVLSTELRMKNYPQLRHSKLTFQALALHSLDKGLTLERSARKLLMMAILHYRLN